MSPDTDLAIRVGVHEFLPLSTKVGDEYTGFDIEYLKEISTILNWQLRFVDYPSIPDLINAVKSDEVDLGIGGITITSAREKIVDFSHPYYRSGLAIKVPYQKESLVTSLIHALTNSALWVTLFVFSIFIVIAGYLFTLIEKNLYKFL